MEAACGNDYRPARGSPAIMMMMPPKYWHDLHGYRHNRPTFCSFFDMGLAMQVDRSNAVVNRIKMVQHCGAILPDSRCLLCNRRVTLNSLNSVRLMSDSRRSFIVLDVCRCWVIAVREFSGIHSFSMGLPVPRIVTSLRVMRVIIDK